VFALGDIGLDHPRPFEGLRLGSKGCRTGLAFPPYNRCVPRAVLAYPFANLSPPLSSRFALVCVGVWDEYGTNQFIELSANREKLINSLFLLVPGAGIEPALDFSKRILSPQRLPIPPPGRREGWRPGPESNRGPRLCRPLHNHSATPPLLYNQEIKYITPISQKPRREIGAGNEARTRDPNLGKVVLYP
jgi:hypothetical protein